MELEIFFGKERIFIKMEYIAINKFEKDISIEFIKYACRNSDMLSFDIKKRIANDKMYKKQFDKLCLLLDISIEEIISKYNNSDFIEQAFSKLKNRKGIIKKWTNPIKGIEKELNMTIEEKNRIKERHIKEYIRNIVFIGAGQIIYNKNIKNILNKEFIKSEYQINKCKYMEDYEICYYKTSKEIEELLIDMTIKSNGIYYIEFPNFPENIKFYKENKCWIEIISHEDLCFINIENEKQYEILIEMGLKLKKQ